MKDGLYQVRHGQICAGLVIEFGRVTVCAPILRNRIDYWLIQAKYVGPDPFTRTQMELFV